MTPPLSPAPSAPIREAGLGNPPAHVPSAKWIQYINLKLAALGTAPLELGNDTNSKLPFKFFA